MLFKCRELKEIKGINKFNASKATNMKGMFNRCNKLINLDLNLDTSNFIDIKFMFNEF